MWLKLSGSVKATQLFVTLRDTATGSVTTSQVLSDARQLAGLAVPLTGVSNGTKDFFIKSIDECGTPDQTGQKRTLTVFP